MDDRILEQENGMREESSPGGQSSSGARGERPDVDHLDAALNHVDTQLSSGHIAVGAAKGILYSLIETLGALVGDPDLPDHARSGYEGLLETARALRTRLGK
jgi:hypothetical protein